MSPLSEMLWWNHRVNGLAYIGEISSPGCVSTIIKTSYTESSLLNDVFSSLSYPYLVMSFLSMFYGQPFGIHLSLHNMLQKRYITIESLVCHSTISSWCCIFPNSSSPVSHRNSGHISSQIESSGTANPAQLCPS